MIIYGSYSLVYIVIYKPIKSDVIKQHNNYRTRIFLYQIMLFNIYVNR